LFCTSQHNTFTHQTPNFNLIMRCFIAVQVTAQHFHPPKSTRLHAAPCSFCTSQHNTTVTHQMTTKLCAAPCPVHYSTKLSPTKILPSYALLFVLHVTAQLFHPPNVNQVVRCSFFVLHVTAQQFHPSSINQVMRCSFFVLHVTAQHFHPPNVNQVMRCSLFCCTLQHNTFIHQMSTKLCAAPCSARHSSTLLPTQVYEATCGPLWCTIHLMPQDVQHRLHPLLLQ